MEDNEDPRRHVITLGRVLLLIEIYLLAAVHVALWRDAFIAPPLFIFFLLHHWMAPSILVAFICCCEFAWRRTLGTAAILFLAIVVAGVGDASLQMV